MKTNIERICRTFNECGSWKKTAEIEGITPQWLATIRKKYISIKAEPNNDYFDNQEV